MAGTSWQGAAISAGIQRGAVDGLNRGAEYLLGASVARVPVDTSNLRGSGAVTPASGSDLVSAVSYNAPGYDVIVHEDLEAHHETGGAKYLEGPATEEAEVIMAIIARSIASGTT
jgi:hypothetical protein